MQGARSARKTPCYGVFSGERAAAPDRSQSPLPAPAGAEPKRKDADAPSQKNVSEHARKPSSVLDDHLSRPDVAMRVQAIAGARRAAACAPIPSCTRWGLQHGQVAKPWVSSYLTFPPLPRKPGRYLSVALSLESPPPAVSRHPALRCSDFPHAFRPAIVWTSRSLHDDSAAEGFCQACHIGH